jgi:hypothetical protein
VTFAGDQFAGTGTWANDAEKKLAYVSIFSSGMDLGFLVPLLIVWPIWEMPVLN